MPTYDYQCSDCGHKFEKFHSITAKPVKLCPSCGKKKVKRLIGVGAGLIFKGSGFYITDYRSEGYKTAAKSDNGAGPATPTAKTEKSESAANTSAGCAATKTTSSQSKTGKTEAKK